MTFSTKTPPIFIPLFLIVLLLISYSHTAASQSAFCGEKCKVRCSKASDHDRCVSYCGICCKLCGCVPSGTYGNKDECPCYRDKFTGEGKRRRPKCP